MFQPPNARIPEIVHKSRCVKGIITKKKLAGEKERLKNPLVREKKRQQRLSYYYRHRDEHREMNKKQQYLRRKWNEQKAAMELAAIGAKLAGKL